MKCKRLVWLIGLVALGAGLHNLRKPPPPEPTPAGMVDYGPEFAKLRTLGLPDTRGGQAVYVRTFGLQCGTGLSEVDMALGGLGWSRPAGKPRVMELVTVEGVNEYTTTFGWPDWLVGPAYNWFQVQLRPRPVVTANPAEIGERLLQILTVGQRGFRWQHGDDAKILLFAAQAHRAGHEGLANRLMHHVVQAQAGTVGVQNASLLFETAVRDFLFHDNLSRLEEAARKSWDWQALVDGYRNLQANLDVLGYENLREKVPLSAVLARVEGKPETIGGPGVTPEVALLAEKLAGATPAQFDSTWFEGAHWLLRDWGQPQPNESPLVSLLRMGPEAIPVLQAMSKDEWPLPLELPPAAWLGSIPVYKVHEWRPDDTFPATRGKLANLLMAHLTIRMVELPDLPGLEKKRWTLEDTSVLGEYSTWRLLPREDRIRYFRSSRFLVMAHSAWNSPLPGESLPGNPKTLWFQENATFDPINWFAPETQGANANEAAPTAL
jgi:hypothetical protein